MVSSRRPRTLADAPAPKNVRILTGVSGLDRVLGGGFRLPSAVLLGGAAGCGKSSLLLQACVSMEDRSVLYITAEETLTDLRERAERFGLGDRLDMIRAVATENIAEAMEEIRASDPRVVILDSINKIRDPEKDTRDKQQNMLDHADVFIKDSRENNRVFVFPAQMNKAEEIAGVKELEHAVDAVLLLTKVGKTLRTLTCPDKNRYGSSANSAKFVMMASGLKEVSEDTTEDSDTAETAADHRPVSVERAPGPSRYPAGRARRRPA